MEFQKFCINEHVDDDNCSYQSSVIIDLQRELQRTKYMLRDTQIHSEKMKVILKKSLKEIRILNNRIDKHVETENINLIKKMEAER